MNENVTLEKSKKFALKVIKVYKFLQENKNEYIMSKQLLRSGTSIGANIAESIYAITRADFINKLHSALKEASETKYWIDLIMSSGMLNGQETKDILINCEELIKMLTAAIKTSKKQ